MKVNELKKIIQEAVRTEVRKVLREELKSLLAVAVCGIT